MKELEKGKWRPWGPLSWIAERMDVSRWGFVGSVGPESRCLACWEVLTKTESCTPCLFFSIKDPPSRFTDEVQQRTSETVQRLCALGGLASAVEDIQLFASTQEIADRVNRFVTDCAPQGDVIVDISTMPKRFFFPTVKMLLDADNVKNLIVTYTLAERYGSGALAEDPEPWAHLPMFGPNYPPERIENVVISVGFQALNLPPLGDQQYEHAEFHLLVPVPGLTPEHHRVWEFLQAFDRDLGERTPNMQWVDWKDVSEIFSHIHAFASGSKNGSIYAPYGPKPISLSMLLYARLTGGSVYYTQPKAYSADYSIGTRQMNNLPETYAYVLKISGDEIYRVD